MADEGRVTLLYYERPNSKLRLVGLSPSILAATLISEPDRKGLSSYIGIRIKNARGVIEYSSRMRSIPPGYAAMALLAKYIMEDEDLSLRDKLYLLDVLDSIFYKDARVRPRYNDLPLVIAYLNALGFRIGLFFHRDPVFFRYDVAFSSSNLRRYLEELSSKAYDLAFRIISEPKRRGYFERFFEVFNEELQDLARYEVSEPKVVKPRASASIKFSPGPIISIHDSPEVEEFFIPYYLAKTHDKKRISVNFGISDRLNPLLAVGSFALFDRFSYASYKFAINLALLETDLGRMPYEEFPSLTGYIVEEDIEDSLSDRLEPGVIYGSLGLTTNKNMYEIMLDQLNDQTLVPAFIRGGSLIHITPSTLGSESFYLNLRSYASIGEILSRRKRDRVLGVKSGYFLGYIINARRFTKTGRYLGKVRNANFKGSPKKVKRLYLGARGEGVSIIYGTPELGSVYSYLGRETVYLIADGKPTDIDISRCISSARSAAYIENDSGKLLGRCVEEVNDLFDRDPFLLRFPEDNDMDVERRLAPTVTAFLLGIYALLKPRAYILYEISPLNPTQPTLKFITESYSAFARSPAGAMSLVIALAILLARIIGPIYSGDRPVAYLSLVSLALTFYIGAVIGLFSRLYDYLFLLKYTSQYAMAHDKLFLMYTVTVAEGGRAVILGLIFLTISLIVESYHVRKS